MTLIPRNERVERHFVVVGTGNPADDIASGSYIGTYQTGSFVWHIFECADNRGGE